MPLLTLKSWFLVTDRAESEYREFIENASASHTMGLEAPILGLREAYQAEKTKEMSNTGYVRSNRVLESPWQMSETAEELA